MDESKQRTPLDRFVHPITVSQLTTVFALHDDILIGFVH